MKAMMILALILLVAVGIWNSPTQRPLPVGSVVKFSYVDGHVTGDVIGRGGAACAALHPDGHGWYLPRAMEDSRYSGRAITEPGKDADRTYEGAYSGIAHD